MRSVISVLSPSKNILPELQKLIPNKQFHKVENAETDQQFKESEIIIADFKLLSPHIHDLPNVKWIQGTAAGVNLIMKDMQPSEPLKYLITRFTGKHFGFLMSEYVVSNIVNYERDAFRMMENQQAKQWTRDGKIYTHQGIFDLTIGILGVGSIGNRIAKTLNFMGAKILGYGRKETLDMDQNEHISAYYTKNSLPELLRNSDYVINVLPSTDETVGLLNGNILENCKGRGTVFINIGRGTIIAEDSLVNALKNGWISGAILDVFEKEPLPTESPLWDMSNVVITPHVSGVSRAKDVAELFKENLTYFEQNLPIPATVDFSKGY